MRLDLSLEIGAFVIMVVVICLQKFGGFAKIRRNRIFYDMLVAQVFATIFNSLTKFCLFYYGTEDYWWIQYVIDFSYVFQYVVVLFAMAYMFSWVGKSVTQGKTTIFLLSAASIVYVEEMLRLFATRHLYIFDFEQGFRETTQIYILNIMTVVAILCTLVYCIVNARVISYSKLTMLSALGLITIVAAIIQMQLFEVAFLDFVISIVLLIMYFVAQNPFEMMDTNTHALNRHMFDELLRADITNRRGFDLVVLALDDFKIINRTYGVTAGDLLLIQVAQFLQGLSEKNIVYRYGSDQFALQIYHGKNDLKQTLDMIAERFRHPWITGGVSTILSTTICCVTWPDDGDKYADIVDVIDFSVLSAKKSGKGSIVFAKDLDLQSLRKEKAIEKAIDYAIEQDTLEVYYQPIYNIEQECYTSAEALVRIHDELLGDISPEIFIPIAERNGSILRMGNMIFEKVCKFIAENNLEDTTIEYIEVNVSVIQCMQTDFVQNLNAVMDEYGVKPSQINLEVTETAAINSLSVLQENVEKLHEQGISFALDDYGSGYATIGYIHQLPFKIIKLDKLMVWDAFENERAGITLRYTVGMLKELKVHIVAEGVETQEQQSRLSDIGCDYLQGWYYSKAVSPEDFSELIQKAS